MGHILSAIRGPSRLGWGTPSDGDGTEETTDADATLGAPVSGGTSETLILDQLVPPPEEGVDPHAHGWNSRDNLLRGLHPALINTLEDSANQAYFRGGYTREELMAPPEYENTTLSYDRIQPEAESVSSDDDGFGFANLIPSPIPSSIRIFSRRAYGRILGFRGFPPDAANANSPFALVGVFLWHRWSNGDPQAPNRLPFIVCAPMMSLGRRPILGGGLTNAQGDLAVGMPVVGTLQAQHHPTAGLQRLEYSLGYIEWSTTTSQEWKLEGPVSFYDLESEFSTDLLLWQEFEHRETRVILPPVPDNTELVIFLNNEGGNRN